jgi:hypothetical protein
VGIELPAIAGFPPLHTAVVVRPDTPGEHFVEALAGAIAGGLSACRTHSAAPLTDGVALDFGFRAGELTASGPPGAGLGDCLSRALDGIPLAGLDPDVRGVSLWLRAAERAALR